MPLASALPVLHTKVVAQDEDDGMSETVELPELKAIEEAARVALQNKALTFLAPPNLVLRLVQSHQATSIGAFVGTIEANDLRADLADRIETLRTALLTIEQAAAPNTPAGAALLRVCAMAKKALHEDDLADRTLRDEFGVGIDDLYRYPVADDYFESMSRPEVGELWRDALGTEYRVVEVDEESFTARLDLVQAAPQPVDVTDLTAHYQRAASLPPRAHGGGDGPSSEECPF